MMERLPQRFCSPSELGNPQMTRVSTFPQRRRLRLSHWTRLLNSRKPRVFFQILVQNQLFKHGYLCGSEPVTGSISDKCN